MFCLDKGQELFVFCNFLAKKLWKSLLYWKKVVPLHPLSGIAPD